VFLVDFGAVQDTYYNTFMRGSTVVGTYGYMAPEQFRGQAVPTTDLYGLGATLLFLLTHCSPADLPTDRLKIDFRSHVQISQEFADWLEKMLEPDVEDRFGSAKEALAVLRGKRIVTTRAGSSVPWKALVGVGIGAVVAVSVLNFFKAPILNFLGLTPPGLEALFKVDITAKDKQGNTPLHRVSFPEEAELLIAKGADVNARNNKGETPLFLPLLRNQEGIVQLLIAKGADVNARNNEGETPLLMALRFTSGMGGMVGEGVVQLLIVRGADVNAKGGLGLTPLHLAGSQEVAELLIAKGANVNAKTNEGDTPLHSARSKEVAELLIAKGANVNAKNNKGFTPVDSIFEAAAWPSIDSSRSKYLDLAEQLIAKSLPFNAKVRFANGSTPLHAAAGSGNKRVAQLLLARGANIHAKNNEGDTPLHSARSKEVAELLIAKGANVNAKNNEGFTPVDSIFEDAAWLSMDSYMASYRSNYVDLAEQLIAKGLPFNAKVRFGNGRRSTPLHAAAGSGNKRVAQLLLAKGVDVNAQDAQGATPLDYATISGHGNLVEFLKSHGGIGFCKKLDKFRTVCGSHTFTVIKHSNG
jgi:ankyrin repeat protein